MKTKFLFSVLMLITINLTAQQGINYKALIKDGGGNIIANQNVDIQFIIYEGVALTNNVYQETHSSVITDSNGIIIVNIGEGTTSDVFADITWGSDDHFLNVWVDIGSGLVDMSTTQFMAVPYALNVTGLEKITEGSNTGWRLIGRDPSDFGNIGNNAVDLSNQSTMPNVGASGSSSLASGLDTYSTGLGSASFGHENLASGTGSIVGGFDSSATGDHSFAIGNDAVASGLNSVAFGGESRALGINSFAMGSNTEAVGNNSTAMGDITEAVGDNSIATGSLTIALGDNSTAMGSDTKAESLNSVAIGRYNIGNGDASSWIDTDPLFEIGNGESISSPSNAFTVLKNGTITAPSFDLSEITDPKALVTKEYADSFGSASGLTLIMESGNTGWRLETDPVLDGGMLALIGDKAIDMTIHDDGFWSFAGASGSYSFVVNKDNYASGAYSSAFGISSRVTGSASISAGSEVDVSGNTSFGFGQGLEVSANEAAAVGKYNIDDTNAAFMVGNGTFSVRNNALTVLKNGTVTAPSLTNTLINTAGNKALVTKEYADTFGGSGLTQITEGSNTGWRLETDPVLDGGMLALIGDKAIDMTIHDDGFWSFAGASGSYSFVVNKDNYASGAYSSAFGISSRVTGSASISAGSDGDVSGNTSFGFGQGLEVSANGATAVGEYNDDDTNAAFMVGNGTFSVRRNALTVMKNGNTTINGQTTAIDVTADSNPAFVGRKNDPPFTPVDVAGVYGENIVDAGWGYGVHGNGNFQGVRGESQMIGIYGTATGPSDTTYGVYGTASGGTSNNYAVYASGDLVYTGNLVDASDSKLKTNVDKISTVLGAISLLNPSRYFIKESYQRSMNMSNKPEYGFIAQELQKVFPELVSENMHPGKNKGDASINYLGVNYIGLIPILTKGIQEQQEELKSLKSKIETQEQTIASLIERIEALENK